MKELLSNQQIECPEYLLEEARKLPPVATAIVNAGAELPIQSAKLAFDEQLIEPVLVGDAQQIRQQAEKLDWDISAIRLVEAGDEVAAAQKAVALAKGNEVAALMKGDVHTDNLLRAVLHRDHGLRTERRLSHVFHMSFPGREERICITDAAINVLPSLEDKLHITCNAIKLLHRLGIAEPKLALLSATEQANDSMPSSVDAAQIAAMDFESAIVNGPFALDNAVSEQAARLKGIDSSVPGQADVLVVPNIEAGNILFKQMVYFMSAAAAGIVLGARVPITLTSRADPPAARLASTALAAIYASADSR